MPKTGKIPVIDLFAGPGGLAEGFSSVIENGERVFDIKLSIEKDKNAHKTLELRSFCRQFNPNQLPEEYYDILCETDLSKREKKKNILFEKYNIQYQEARKEALKAELGNDDFPPEMVDRRIKEALNREKNWVLIGGPPCQAYSVVGRSRVGGIASDDHRIYLYKEYLRIIAIHQPAVFIMENVQGLLSARMEGQQIFEWILRDLKDPETVFTGTKSKKYQIYSLVRPEIERNSDYLIKTELYGIPQKRHRVILLGLREDIKVTPGILKKKEIVSLSSVISDLPKIRASVSKRIVSSLDLEGKKKRIYESLADTPDNWSSFLRKFSQEILDWNILKGKKIKMSYSPPKNNTGSEYISENSGLHEEHPLAAWYKDEAMNGVTHHQSRSHLLEDLRRYFFASVFAGEFKRIPKLDDFRGNGFNLLPDHNNADSGKFKDRFRVQLPDMPATTITSHISKDGHYFIHYDPEQCRSFTVREAARIQTFPDNYLFWGSRTEQFHQVGNAVPPFLAKQIAEIVLKIISET